MDQAIIGRRELISQTGSGVVCWREIRKWECETDHRGGGGGYVIGSGAGAGDRGVCTPISIE